MAGKRASGLRVRKSAASVTEFLNNMENARKREDARTAAKRKRRITGNRPTM
tara:strand:- start:20296 stop:20451 length:156 start_codon:yes stop_codon:yes gene_type:complete